MRQRLFPDRDHPDVASSLNNLASCLYGPGRLERVLPLLRKALEMEQRLYPDQPHPDVAWSLDNVATCLNALGRSADALPLFQQAVEMARRLQAVAHVDGREFPDLHLRCARLALRYLECSETQEAVALLDEAIAQIERLRASALSLPEQERAEYFGQLKRFGAYEAMLHAQLRLGRADQALRYLEQGRARSLLDLLARSGDDPLETARRHAARDRNQKQVEEIDALKGKLAAADGHVSELRGELSLARGRRKGLSEERRDLKDTGKTASLDAAWVAGRLAEIERQLPLLDKRLPALEGTKDRPGELAQAAERQRELQQQRFRLIQDVLEVGKPAEPGAIQGILGADERMLLYSITRKKALLLVVSPHGEPIRHYELAWPAEPGSDSAERAAVTDKTLTRAVDRYVLGCLRRGFALQRGVLEGQEGEAAARSAEQLDAHLAQIDGRLRTLKREVPQGQAEADLFGLGHRLFDALIPEALRAELMACSRVYVVPHGALHRLPFEMLVTQAAGDAAESRFWLDDGPALAYGPSGSQLVWSRARRDKQKRRPLPYEVVALGGAVYHRNTTAPPPQWPSQGVYVQRVDTGSDAALAELLAGDVIVRLDGQPVADKRGLRRRVPLIQEALEDAGRDADEPFVVVIWRAGAEKELRLSASALSAKGVKLARGAAREDEAYASAVRGSLENRLGELGDLPGAKREVESIYRSLSGRAYSESAKDAPGPVRLLLKDRATESQLRLWAPQGRFLHLAAHALADETDAMSWSGLALTVPPIKSPADDGFLTLGELLRDWGDKLSACELVVLSACQTQVGPQQKDEAVFALPLGFQFAGAPSVIASLWSVNDASTAALMSDFYAGLASPDGRPADGPTTDGTKLAAFTAARRALRQRFPEPYFWAPFIYIGDPR